MPKTAWITAALFCQNILNEKDESISLIRLPDRFFLAPDFAPKEGELPAVQLSMLVAIRGTEAGIHLLAIDSVTPSGKTTQGMAGARIELKSPEHSFNLMIKSTIALVEGPGLYWFEVSLDKELCVRVPLQIEVARPGHPQKL